MAGSGRGQDAVLADEELLDSVCSTDLDDQLDDLGVPETTVTSDDEERAWAVKSAQLEGGAKRQEKAD